MKFLFNHQNFNVLDLEKSIAFYEEAPRSFIQIMNKLFYIMAGVGVRCEWCAPSMVSPWGVPFTDSE